MNPIQSSRSWLIFSFLDTPQDRGQAGAGAPGPLLEGRASPPPAARPSFSAPGFQTLVAVSRAVEFSTFYSGCRAFAFARAAFNCIRRTGPILCDSIYFSKAQIRLPVPWLIGLKPAKARPSAFVSILLSHRRQFLLRRRRVLNLPTASVTQHRPQPHQQVPRHRHDRLFAAPAAALSHPLMNSLHARRTALAAPRRLHQQPAQQPVAGAADV